MTFELFWNCQGCGAGSHFARFSSNPLEGVGAVLEMDKVAASSAVPSRCGACGHDAFALEAAQETLDPMGWLLEATGEVRSAYLGLRDNGMDDETAREMAVVAYMPPPTE